MSSKKIEKVVIVGGGTAGWMTAAALSHFFEHQDMKICLIESDAIGTVGVGEATLPHLRFFNKKLGIDERDFMRQTNASYKMGIEFVNWGQIGDAYIHPFGDYGEKLNNIAFHHYWLKARQNGDKTRICDYSLPVVAAAQNRFQFPSSDEKSLLSTYSYAYHVDAGLYAKYLRNYSEKKGVARVEGQVAKVKQHPQTGFIESVELKNGRVVDGELFIDCSGFRGLLIEQCLQTGYQDWSHWLPCDSAFAVGCEKVGPTLPYSRATAREAGWQWRIPLQHRTGNGHVYCSQYMEKQQALDTLMTNLDGAPINEPIHLTFTTGKRNKVWNKNCIAIGLSGGFLEPLESTSIFLIQDTIDKLLALFPNKDFHQSPIDEFNQQINREYERIRDFLILHYHATQRTDSAFWNYVRTMSIPDDLAHKIDLYKKQGHIAYYRDGLFYEASWLAVYTGQRVEPQHHHPLVNTLPPSDLQKVLMQMKENIARHVPLMNYHDDTLNAYLCQGSEMQNSSVAKFSLYAR